MEGHEKVVNGGGRVVLFKDDVVEISNPLVGGKRISGGLLELE